MCARERENTAALVIRPVNAEDVTDRPIVINVTVRVKRHVPPAGVAGSATSAKVPELYESHSAVLNNAQHVRDPENAEDVVAQVWKTATNAMAPVCVPIVTAAPNVPNATAVSSANIVAATDTAFSALTVTASAEDARVRVTS